MLTRIKGEKVAHKPLKQVSRKVLTKNGGRYIAVLACMSDSFIRYASEVQPYPLVALTPVLCL